MQALSEQLGLFLKDGIIAIAEVLTLSDSRPGQIVGAILIATIILGVCYVIRTHRQVKAVQLLDQKIRDFPDIPSFAEGHSQLIHDLRTGFRNKGPRETVWEAFDEFNETVVADDIDGPLRLRNSIRPASFLNVEDLGFGPGIFRILPNTLVSAGLLLTFLGLVAALHQFSESMNTGSGGMDQAMQSFMQIASAKFVMSLAGLFCSILFTFLLRTRQNKMDAALHRLCIGIERRLVFVSLEDIGFRQLRAATEQREHLREIGMGTLNVGPVYDIPAFQFSYIHVPHFSYSNTTETGIRISFTPILKEEISPLETMLRTVFEEHFQRRANCSGVILLPANASCITTSLNLGFVFII